MVKYTENYNLKKPEGTDNFSVLPYNENMDILDTKIKLLETAPSEMQQQLTTHLDENNPNAHEISNIVGLESELNRKFTKVGIPLVNLGMVNGFIGDVKLGQYENGTKILSIDIANSVEVATNTAIFNIPGGFRLSRDAIIPLYNAVKQEQDGFLRMMSDGNVFTASTLTGGHSYIVEFTYGGV